MPVVGHMGRLVGAVMQAAGVGNELQLAADRLPYGRKGVKITVDVLVNHEFIDPHILVLLGTVHRVDPTYAGCLDLDPGQDLSYQMCHIGKTYCDNVNLDGPDPFQKLSDLAVSFTGIMNIVKNFYDSTVGCVSSVDRFIDPDGKITGEGAYVKYEMFLRSLEMKVNTIIGLSGSFFAARREVCQNWASDLQSDFNTLLNSIKIGLRGVSDPESIGYYKNIANEKKEFDRKVRTILRGITVFMKNWQLLNPFRYGLFAWQFFSHKLCRWLVPFAMMLAFFSNALMIAHSGFYRMVFILQIVFYGIALGSICTTFRRWNLLRIPFFFVMVNLSTLNAWYRYSCGERMTRWKPSAR